MKWLDDYPLPLIVLVCLLLGLAPYMPEPHVWEKLKLLAAGSLGRPLDIFDLLLHGAPFGVLVMKLLQIRRSA
jgi:hypothetical protein